MVRTLLMLGIVTMAATTAQATVLIPLELGELSREARTIARGRVVDVQGRWSDDRRRIETLVTLDVESYLKGALGAELQFRIPGGQLGRFRSIVVGAPRFSIGQRVVVFLEAQAPGLPHVLGLSQGVFRIVASAGRDVVTPAPLVAEAGPGRRVVRGANELRPPSLLAFEQQVRALAGGAQ
jgi:hypothetical protein